MSQGDITRSEGEPHDRLTRLCAVMTDALDAHPDRGDVKCIVFLDSEEEERRGGLQLHGYFMHLRAIFRSQGRDLMFAPLAGSPGSN